MTTGLLFVSFHLQSATGVLENDAERLRTLYRTCDNARAKIRNKALYAVSRGKRVEAIADVLDVDESAYTIG